MRNSRRPPVTAAAAPSKFPCDRLPVEKLSGSLGKTKMRILEIVAICVALAGCAGSPQGVASTSQYGNQFVGKDVDALVAQIGRPSSSKRLDDGQSSYVWQLAAPTAPASDQWVQSASGGLYGDGNTPGYMTDDLRLCKVSATTSPEGIVTQLNAEDSNGTGAPSVTLGFNRSICAQRFGTKPRT
jgi:hypothetical protein